MIYAIGMQNEEPYVFKLEKMEDAYKQLKYLVEDKDGERIAIWNEDTNTLYIPLGVAYEIAIAKTKEFLNLAEDHRFKDFVRINNQRTR